MRTHTLLLAALLAATAVRAQAQAEAQREILLVGLDGKTFFRPHGSENGPDGRDALAVVDISDPARPRLAHVIEGLANSVYGPPTNLAVTPDGRLGLVASAVTMRQEGAAWYARGDDRLHVIDLESSPPRLAGTLRVGRQPSGLAIAKAGDLALVANREGRSVTVLAIRDGAVRVSAEVPVGDEAAAVAISPDGTRALVAKNAVGRVGVLAIRDGAVTYEAGLDMPVGPGTYGLGFTPDGRHALSGNTGVPASDGHADTVALIALDSPRPRVVDHAGVGDTAEALAVAPDGRHAAVSVVKGAAAPHDSPGYTPGGAAVLVRLDGDRVRAVSEAPAGAVTQGIAFDRSGRYAYLGSYADRTLAVYAVAGDAITDTGYRLALPGQPASLGGRP